MIESLGELNERFYKIYGRLHENQELLTTKQIDYMAQCLFEQYKSEYYRLLLESEITEKDELCRLEIRHSNYIPRRRFLRRNRALKILQRELGFEIATLFDEREKQLDDEIEAYCTQPENETPEEQAAVPAAEAPQEDLEPDEEYESSDDEDGD